MEQLELDLEMPPVPDHVLRWERILDRNSEGYEPLDSWETGDVAQAFACLAIELRERGEKLPEAQ